MSSSSENEVSDETESYTSEGDFAVSNACESPSSSEDPDPDPDLDIEGIISRCPRQNLTENEYDEVLQEDGLDGKLYPYDVAAYIQEHFEDIYTPLQHLLDSEGDTKIYVAFFLAKLLQTLEGKLSCIPKTGCLDVCIFSRSKPVRILTFILGSHDSKAVRYNAELARNIMISINNNLMSSFTFINGAIDRETYQSSTKFDQMVKQIEASARTFGIPASLHMTTSKRIAIFASFLKMLGPKDNIVKTTLKTELSSPHIQIQSEGYPQCPHETESQGNICPYKEQLDEILKKGQKQSSGEPQGTQSRPPRKIKHSASAPEMYRGGKSSNTVLHEVCRGGKLGYLRAILKNKKANIDCTGKYGRTPVMVAAKKGSKDEFDELVKAGCDLRGLDDMGQTILHLSCLGGCIDIVKYLISSETCGIEDVDQNGQRALAKAAATGHKDIFDLLVEKGCSLTAVDFKENNVLHFACQTDTNRMALVSDILACDVIDINSKGEGGLTPLMISAQVGDTELMKLLLSNGCILSEVDENGNNALHIACLWNNRHTTEMLLSNANFAIDINDKGKNGRTALHMAAAKGNKKLVELLISKEAHLQQTDDDNNTILHVACLGHSVDIVHYLLYELKFDIDCKGQCGKTPMMMAANKGYRDLCEVLVQYGSSMLARDIEMNTILHFAVLSGNKETVEFILTKSTGDINSRGENGRTPIMIAAEYGYKSVFDLLLSRGCDTEMHDDSGYTILHLACIKNKLDFLRHLIQQKIVDINAKDGTSQTPVMLAARRGHKKVFELLVDNGCRITDVDVDDDGNNVLHSACIGGSLDIVDYIVSRDLVDINSIGHNGNTPILMAASEGHRGVFDLLVTKDCSVDKQNDDGNNILHLACLGGHLQFVRYLLFKEFVHIDSLGFIGSTSVMQAAKRGHKKIIDALVDQSCDLNIVDRNGENVLHWACVAGKVQIVEYLLKLGQPDMNGQNAAGESPAELAFRHNRENVHGLLMQHGCNI